MKPETRVGARKRPRQQRSRATVEAILTATARVLVERGYEATTTNHVAQVAGVSIGSLYQYFPNKAALVMAVVEHHCTAMYELLEASAAALGDAPIPVAVRSYVTAMVEAHAVNPDLHRVLVQQAMHIGLETLQQIDQASQGVVRAYLERRREEILPRNLEMAAYVLVRSVEAVVHGMVLEASEIDPDAVADEVIDLVLRYLLGEAG